MSRITKSAQIAAQTARTPGPWVSDFPYIRNATDEATLAHVEDGRYNLRPDTISRPEQIANAAFIVQACNAHDDLVAALRSILSECDDDFRTDAERRMAAFARAALAKAGAL